MKLTKKIHADNNIQELEQSLVKSGAPTLEKEKKERDPLKLCLGLGLLFGFLIALVPCYLIYQSQVMMESDRQIAESAAQRAELTADKIDRYLRSQAEKIEFFASQTLLRNAVVDADKPAVEQAVSLVEKQIEGALAVSAIARDEAALDALRFPPIRFAELALIKSAESGASPQPELSKVGDDWILHFARPIAAGEDDRPSGVLWVSVNSEKLMSILDAENQGMGKIELYQKFSRRDRILALALGSAVGSEAQTPSVVKVPETNWEVSAISGPGSARVVHINIGSIYASMLGALALCLALGAAFGFAFGSKARKRQQRSSIAKKANQMPKAGGELGRDALNPLMDVEIHEDDSNLLGLGDDDEEDEQPDTSAHEDVLSLDEDVFDFADDAAGKTLFPEEVFRAYDIRGIANQQITKEFALKLGMALGSEVVELREQTIAVARDARTHSPELTEYLIRGILSTGCNVLNLGTVPTPLMYFALETMEEVASGVVVTASHNPAEYNGFKTILSGVSRSSDDIQNLRIRMIKGEFIKGEGQELRHDIVPSYIETIFSDVALASEMHVVVDAGNAVGGKVAPQLFEELGCRVEPLFCDLDGSFPNHDPDPSNSDNLSALIAKVQEINADLGIALDGDADRLTVVSPSGKIYPADRLLMLFAKDIVSRSPGADVVFDVKSTRHLNACITSLGGRPVMWKTGHSHMRSKIRETGAVVGAEFSGHIFIQDRWFGFDDGMYAAARLFEILSLQGETLDEALAEFPESMISPEYRIEADDSRKFDIIERLKQSADFGDGRISDIDGLRVDFGHGWGLVRASNTAPEITLRFEADDEKAMHDIKSLFVRELKDVDSTLNFSWKH